MALSFEDYLRQLGYIQRGDDDTGIDWGTPNDEESGWTRADTGALDQQWRDRYGWGGNVWDLSPAQQAFYGSAGLVAPAGPGQVIPGGTNPAGNYFPLPGEFSPEQQAARQRFLELYPGYAQIAPSMVTAQGGIRQPADITQAASLGEFLLPGVTPEYDEEFGYRVPVGSFGYTGQKGGPDWGSLLPVLGMAGGLMAIGPLGALTGIGPSATGSYDFGAAGVDLFGNPYGGASALDVGGWPGTTGGMSGGGGGGAGGIGGAGAPSGTAVGGATTGARMGLLSDISNIVSIAGGISSLFDTSASKAAGAAAQSSQVQAQLALEAAALARERWNYYKERAERIRPQVESAEDLVFQQAIAGYPDRSEEERRLAAGDVEQAFARERESTERRLRANGIDPTSPAGQALISNLALNKAKTQALAMDTAGRTARNRAEDMSFTRRLQALALDKGLPSDIGLTSAASAAGAASRGALDLARYGGEQQARGGYALQRGLYDLDQAGWFRPQSAQSTQITDPYSYYAGDPFSEQAMWAGDPGYRHGGPVRALPYRRGYANGGPINVDGRQVVGRPGRDSIPAVIDGKQRAALDSGEFVVPKDVVAAKGTEFFAKLIEKYHRQQPSRGMANGGAIRIALPKAVEDAIYATSALRGA